MVSPPLAPLTSLRGCPCGGCGWGYPKLKMKVIFKFPTFENPRIDITHDIWWYLPLSSPSPPPPGGWVIGGCPFKLGKLPTNYGPIKKISSLASRLRHMPPPPCFVRLAAYHPFSGELVKVDKSGFLEIFFHTKNLQNPQN